jgi:hypothetical protein
MTRLDLYDTRNNHSQTAAWWWEIGVDMGCHHHQTKSGGPRPPQLGWGGFQTKNAFKKFQQTRRMSCAVQMKFYVQNRFAVGLFPVFHRAAAIKN